MANQLLREGASVKETAAKIGYKYPNHFSRQFKKYWGHSPMQTARFGTTLRVLVPVIVCEMAPQLQSFLRLLRP
jgi:AraC-like DNA-binding protein